MELVSEGIKLIVLLCVLGCAHTQVVLDESIFNGSLHPFPGYSDRALFAKEKMLPLRHYTCKHTRPLMDHTEPLWMSVGLCMQRIIKLDAATQTLTFLAHMMIEYQHDFLAWEEDVDSFAVTFDRIWIPDFDVLNTIDRRNTVDTLEYIRAYQGACFMWLLWVYSLPCTVSMTDFPFDVQRCIIVLGPLHEPTGRYNLTTPYWDPDYRGFIIADHASVTSEWQLIDYYSKKINVTRASGVVYEEVHCTLVLKRFSPFYVQSVLVPSLVVVLITLTLFWIPIVRPDRIAVGMSAFTMLIVLLLMVVKISPPSSDLKIAHYYSLQIFLVSVSTFLSAIILVIAQATTVVPTFFRVVYVKGFGRVIGITQQYEKVYPLEDNDDAMLSTVRDWQIVGLIIDRMNFMTYFLVAVIGISVLFPYPKD